MEAVGWFGGGLSEWVGGEMVGERGRVCVRERERERRKGWWRVADDGE